VKVGDVITVRDGSRDAGLFTELADKHEKAGVPAWLSADVKKLSGEVKTAPVFNPAESLFDPEQVMEYYSR